MPTRDDLLVSGCSVNGFERHGLLLNGENSGAVIKNCSFQFNGGTAIALFRDNGNAPSNVLCQGNQLSNNGENGIDSNASSLTIIANTLNGNGWANATPSHALAEGHGVLLNADGVGVASVTISNNHMNNNWRNGIYALDASQWAYDDISIQDNYLISNGTQQIAGHGWGVLIEGTISSSLLGANDAMDNYSGCYSVPASGISVGSNCCNGQGGPGPGGAPCLL